MGLFSLFQRKLPVDTAKIEAAITDLESYTSAEVRVVVELKAKLPPPARCCPTHKSAEFMEQVDSQPCGVEPCTPAEQRAKMLFEELGMTQTVARNGVLIYLCFKPHYIAVIGDQGIHEKVGQAFWQSVYQIMRGYCQRGEFTQGICEAIMEISTQLAEHFPIQDDDVNELPNGVIVK